MTEPTADAYRCDNCRSELAEDFIFCPYCGNLCRREITGIRAMLREFIAREKQLETIREKLWRPVAIQMHLLGTLILTVPDAVVLAILYRWLALDLTGVIRFLATDALIGVIAILLIRICTQRGATGELTLAALRAFQVPLVSFMGLNPFAAQREILNVILFGAVPLLIFGVAVLVFRLHLTTVLDLLALAVTRRRNLAHAANNPTD